MNKLNLMEKQLQTLHEELRKVKAFFKESSKNFRNFYSTMTNNLRMLNGSDLFNDIHYTNYVNVNIIELFTAQINDLSYVHSRIHSELKAKGNEIKQLEKDISKRLKLVSSMLKKEGKDCHDIIDNDMEHIFKDLSASFVSVRDSIRKSFVEYINSLCSFSDTKEEMKQLAHKSEENYNECSPIFCKKFTLLTDLNFRKERENTFQPKYEQKSFGDVNANTSGISHSNRFIPFKLQGEKDSSGYQPQQVNQPEYRQYNHQDHFRLDTSSLKNTPNKKVKMYLPVTEKVPAGDYSEDGYGDGSLTTTIPNKSSYAEEPEKEMFKRKRSQLVSSHYSSKKADQNA